MPQNRLRLFWLPLLLLMLARCTATRPADVGSVPPPVERGGPAPVEVVAVIEDDAPLEPPYDWHLRSTQSGYPGINLDEAYALVEDRTPQPVIVAVIDSGVDVAHEDLEGRIWVNSDEIPGNGIDDDGNGYADDIHGWSFLGGADGRNVGPDTYEVTREYVRLRDRFENVQPRDVPAADREAYAYFEKVRDEYQRRRTEARQMLPQIKPVYEIAQEAVPVLRAHFGKEAITATDLATIGDDNPRLARARDVYSFLLANNITLEDLSRYYKQLDTQVNYGFNPDFDPRGIVGDNYADLSERYYGNADVAGPDPDHGTHVAGIIAARRDNNTGAVGISDAARIMVLRAVPNGDERDKDIANAIRYAADNGARIVNMSFGKGYSPQKEAVDAAVLYATGKGVLLVNAAGNDGENMDVTSSFPTAQFLDGSTATTWVGVGASAWDTSELAASFSNYGAATVDLFAPGVDIYSTLPGSTYGPNNGTSMAAPVVSGVAALLLSYYPELTAQQVRDILRQSARRYDNTAVMQPGGQISVDFCTLASTCGVVDAAAAMQLASQIATPAGGR